MTQLPDYLLELTLPVRPKEGGYPNERVADIFSRIIEVVGKEEKSIHEATSRAVLEAAYPLIAEEQTRKIVDALREQATEFVEVEKHPASRWADFIEREFGGRDT